MRWSCGVTLRDITYMIGRAFFILLAFLFLSPAASFSWDSSTSEFQSFLQELKQRFEEYGWTDLKPEEVPWEYHRVTRGGRPMFFDCFGSSTENCTIMLASVHGDEIPTMYVLFKLAGYLKDHPDEYRDRCIVIVPLVNPDGFFMNPPQRVNANGVDLNRNLPTKDWRDRAHKHWETKARKNRRYYPGSRPASEQETRFQVALIRRFKPRKILSLHSPLGFYDYDGPSASLDNFEKWLEKISKETNYPLKKFGVYPGSLGNYAGLERSIFTVTLELPSSEPKMGGQFYEKFKSALSKFMSIRIDASSPFTIADESLNGGAGDTKEKRHN